MLKQTFFVRRSRGLFVITVLTLLALMHLTAGFAQRSSDAQTLFMQAQQAAAQAKEAYAGTMNHPDQPLWRDALTLGQQALDAAPNDPEVTRFMAETYSYVRWYIRAWQQWQAYLNLGGDMTDETKDIFAEVGTELGFARYQANDSNGALPYYQAVHDVDPTNTEALTWLGRIYLETYQPQQALSYWQQLLTIDPGNEGATYYLNLTKQQLEVGVDASQAFQQGIQAYEANNLQDALELFEAAAGFNDAFVDAFVWAGRTSLELGLPDKAIDYWQRVQALDPGDTRAAYFLEVAQAQKQWGSDAANAFYEGMQLYESGDLEAASVKFSEAAQLNSAYKDAFVWSARVYQELERPVLAVDYWQKVIALDPEDTRATYFLSLAEKELAYGTQAGRAFVKGLQSYEVANFALAEEAFKEAVTANPDLADAWGWLGRIYFANAEYELAAVHYERAAELEPENEDYTFFAEEARFLSQEQP